MFLLLPVGVDYRAQRYPVVTFTLMGLNVLVYLITLVATLQGGEAAEEWILGNLWLIPSESSWHAYLTTLFVHGGFFHLLGNMIYLFLFGSPVEDLIGRVKFAGFYLLGGLMSDFMHIALTPAHFASDLPLGGASGAISACIGGYVLLLHRSRIEFKYVVFLVVRFWSGEFWLPAWLVISFWFLEDLAMAVLSVAREDEGGGVAFGAHIGGFVSGLAMMGVEKLWRRSRGEAGPPERWASPGTGRPAAQADPVDLPTTYLFVNDAQMGPFTPTRVQEMIELGSLGPDALYWQEGMSDWRSISELGNPTAQRP